MSDREADPGTGEEENFLSRWSRRKHADRAGESIAAPVEEAVNEAVDETVAVEQGDNLPGDEDMPPVESLDEDSDYSGFMSPKVSEELRRIALRKLFSSQVFNVRDGLDDYDDDFTSFTKLGDVVTAEMRYQMKRMQEAMNEDSDIDASQQEAGEEVLAADEPGLDSANETDELIEDGSDQQLDDAVSAREVEKHPTGDTGNATYIKEETDGNRNE